MVHALFHGDPDLVTSRLPVLMLPAFVGCFLCARFEVPGLLSCFQLAAFAVSAAIFSEFRVERGLWMLAALYFVIWTGISLTWLYGGTRDWIFGVAVPVTLIADAAIATSIIHSHTKYLWKIVICNRSISRE
jgi:hypothetical protein